MLREAILEEEVVNCNRGGVSQRLPVVGIEMQNQSYMEALVQMMSLV